MATARAHCNGSFNRDSSQIANQRVAFVYESSSPHLRLTWEWRTGQDYGPIEHQIRIENLDNKEIWIPLQDSLAFDWQIDPHAPLDQLFVEKGANTPSPIGTHEVSVTDGYRWTGTSSTYGDTDERDPREIIPWTLVERHLSGPSRTSTKEKRLAIRIVRPERGTCGPGGDQDSVQARLSARPMPTAQVWHIARTRKATIIVIVREHDRLECSRAVFWKGGNT